MRDGKHGVTELMSFGQHILGRRHVEPGVLATLQQLQIEGTFRTGTHLVTVDQPISTDEGDLRKALYGSFLPVPSSDTFAQEDESQYEDEKKPGALVLAKTGNIALYKSRKRVRLRVTNRGDRAVQVSSGVRREAYGYLHCRLKIRSDLITTSSKPTRDWTSIVSNRMATISTSRPAPLCVSSLATPRR